MPIASLHMGQRRMSRFAADGSDPNLRIIPRTRFGLPSASSSIVCDNKLNALKKDGEPSREFARQECAAQGVALKGAHERFGTKNRYLPIIGFVPRALFYNPNPYNSYETDQWRVE
jgi:hypothetical protein